MSPADAQQLASFIARYLELDAEITRLRQEQHHLQNAWLQCVSLRGMRVARRFLDAAPQALLDALLVGQLREVQCALAMLAKAHPPALPEVPHEGR